MKCPSCGTEGLPNRKFCGVCGHAFPEQAADSSMPPSRSGGYSTPPSGAGGYATPPAGAGGYAMPTSGGYTPPAAPPYAGSGMGYGGYGAAPPLEQRYKALRVIAVIYKVLAFVVAGLYAIIGLLALANGASRSSSFGGALLLGGFLGALLFFLFGALAFVFFYGAAEFITLFINIEENTRTTNEILQRRNG